MPFISPALDFFSLSVQKRYGLPDSYGGVIFGWCRFGDDDWRQAVYQRRTIRKDYWTKTYHPAKGRGWCKMKYYYTKNPRYIPQQNNRNKFGDAMRAWQSLTDEQKKVYSITMGDRGLNPHNKFIRQYMKSH